MNERANAEDKRVLLLAGSERELVGLLPIEPGQAVSRRVMRAPGASIVRISLDSGQGLSEHEAHVPVLIQVLSGQVEVEADGRSTRMTAGAVVYLAGGVRHSVRADGRSHLMLTLLRGAGDSRGSRAASAGEESAATAERAPIADHLVLASNGADSVALSAITRHHAEISGALATHVSRILDVAGTGDENGLLSARDAFSKWSRDTLTALFAAEAAVLYPVAEDIPDGAGLVRGLAGDLDRIGELLQRARTETDPVRLAAATVAARVAVEHHLNAETERLLPILAQSSGHSLAGLWAEVERGLPVAERRAEPVASGAAAVCECGVLEEEALPELDVRTVPHAIRHATVFGALDSLGTHDGLVLVAPHDPLPLLAQIRQRTPGRFEVTYLQRGPDDWRLRFTRNDVGVGDLIPSLG